MNEPVKGGSRPAPYAVSVAQAMGLTFIVTLFFCEASGFRLPVSLFRATVVSLLALVSIAAWIILYNKIIKPVLLDANPETPRQDQVSGASGG